MRSKSRPKRKVSGGRYVSLRKKRLTDLASEPTLTGLGELKRKTIFIRSGKLKTRLLKTNMANVYDKKSKTHKIVKIKTILENPANRHYVRRNIITKGSVIDTDLGKARVTNKPGQEGAINAVLI